ncbi:glycoside hydrolase family 9 protein, partial [Backusella circina FSU 941]
DAGIKLPRPCYQINETYFGTDVAAMTAAALASSARFFSITNDPEDLAYASMLTLHAIQLYNASVSIVPYRSYQTSVPSVRHSYASSDYTDDLALASLLLYKITKDTLYINNAHYFYNSGIGLGGRTQPLGWDNKYGAVYVLFSEVMLETGDEYALFMKRLDTERYLDGIVEGTSVNRTRGGLLWWDDFSTVNSNANALSTSFLLVSYSTNVLRKMIGKSENNEVLVAKVREYEALANSQLNYVLGKNPIKQNYVVGEGPDSPRYPHSALANPDTGIYPNSTDIPLTNVLYGALVGGPSRTDSYHDSYQNWEQNEVALDYNAPYQNVLAYKIMYHMSNSTDEPNSLPPRYREKNTDEQSTLPKWVIPVSLTLSAVVFVAIGAVVWRLYGRRRVQARNKGVMTTTNVVSSDQYGNGSAQSLQHTLSCGSTLRG